MIEEAEKLADRVAYLEGGSLRFVGTLAELKARSGMYQVSFSSVLALPELRLFDPLATIAATTAGFDAQLADGNSFIRALLQADPHAMIHQFSRASLEAALRTLS